MSTRQQGTAGETLAAEFLEYKGYEIIERNFFSRYGEIDIIAREGGEVVFVEVKMRKNAEHGTAAEAVTPAKQRKLQKTALMWLASHGEQPARFDVVEIYTDTGEKPLVHLIRNAIY